jgi:PhnB protein
MSTISLTPFLLFDGNCAEAMAFYQSCLGGDLEITKLGETPMKAQASSDVYDRVAYARLKSNSLEFSATDWLHPTRRPKPGNTVALYLTAGSLSQLREIFDRLAAGADQELLDDLREMPFGTYGHLADKFGVHWFFRGEQST